MEKILGFFSIFGKNEFFKKMQKLSGKKKKKNSIFVSQ
jgi:hypothetical protein